jgi:membrane-associated phospholipid phosphatase
MVLGLDFTKDVSALGGIPVYAAIAVVFLLLGHLEQFYQLILAIVILYAAAIPVRMFWFKDRPRRETHGGDFITRFNANSLISLHSARALILAFVLSSFFAYKIPLVILFAAIVLAVAAARIAMQRHKWDDIVTGLIAGLVCSVIALYFI